MSSNNLTKQIILAKRFKKFRFAFASFTAFTVIIELVFAIAKRNSDYEIVLSNSLLLNIASLLLFGLFVVLFSGINKTFQKFLFLGFLLIWLIVFAYSMMNLLYINRQPLVASGVIANRTLEECLDLTPKTRDCGYYSPSPYSYPDDTALTNYRVSIGLDKWNYRWTTMGRYGKAGVMSVLTKIDKYINTQVYLVYNYSLVSIQSVKGCYIYRALDPYYQDTNTQYCI